VREKLKYFNRLVISKKERKKKKEWRSRPPLQVSMMNISSLMILSKLARVARQALGSSIAGIIVASVGISFVKNVQLKGLFSLKCMVSLDLRKYAIHVRSEQLER